MAENQPCNDRIEEKDGIDFGSRKRKRRGSMFLLSRLLRSRRDGCSY